MGDNGRERAPLLSYVSLGLVLGQVLSIVMTLMAVLSKLLVENYNFSTPALQNALGYFATLAIALTPYSIKVRIGVPNDVWLPWRLLAILAIAFADSQASFFANLAFRYRVNVSSAGMLSSFTIPCVMVLSFFFLSSRYRKRQVFGVITALFGLSCVFIADATVDAVYEATGSQTSSATLTGDALVLASAAIYALANVISEGYVKTQEFYEYLLWVGVFGLAISLVQFWYLEWPLHKAETKQISHVEAAFAAYAALFALFYFLTAKFLTMYDAVALNLSLLTTGLWGMLFGTLIFHEQIPVLKVMGYVGVVAGISMYTSLLKAVEHPEGTSLTRPQGRRRSSLGSRQSYGSMT